MEAISDAPKYGSLKEALIGIYGEEVQVKDRRAVHGGDANEAYRLFLSNGESLFIIRATMDVVRSKMLK